MSQIHPIHSSIRKLNRIRTPENMDIAKTDRDTREELTAVALSIFTDATNVGVSLQDALLAIYLSGLNHGACAAQANKSPEPLA